MISCPVNIGCGDFVEFRYEARRLFLILVCAFSAGSVETDHLTSLVASSWIWISRGKERLVLGYWRARNDHARQMRITRSTSTHFRHRKGIASACQLGRARHNLTSRHDTINSVIFLTPYTTASVMCQMACLACEVTELKQLAVQGAATTIDFARQHCCNALTRGSRDSLKPISQSNLSLHSFSRQSLRQQHLYTTRAIERLRNTESL